jgi:hypothetical protein
MSEITNYLEGYLNELNNYMERLNSDRLSRKDRRLFLEMSNEYYDVFKESAGEKTGHDFPAGLLDAMVAFNDNMIGQEASSQELANQYHQTIVTTAQDYIGRIEHSELQFGIFQKDAEILHLQEEKLQMMQKLVDFEMRGDGQISPETAAILEVQHSEIVNGQVREIGAWEQHSLPEGEHVQQEKKEQPEEVEESETDTETARVKLQLPYMKRETFLKAKEELKRMGAKYDPKEKVWYVEQSVGQDMLSRIHEYLQKQDDAIYLKLPSVDAQKFKQLLGEIKQNGARYNPDRKKWYITEKMDLSKFRAYLPEGGMQNKDSVHQKLNQYKADSMKTSPTGQSPGHHKNVPERI